MRLEAIIQPDGTLRLLKPVDLKKSIGQDITIKLVGTTPEEEEKTFFSLISTPVLTEIWEGDEDPGLTFGDIDVRLAD